MRVLDLTFGAPALNLAFDEVLLERADADEAGETLWFWESPRPFAVLGVSQVLADEVDEAECARGRVPVYRRCSAGGCVLQGAGCLNYSLILRYDRDPELRGIRSSYGYILGRIAETLRTWGIEASHRGISDLAVGEMKFSGNAQRRRKIALLHHGTFLYDYDLALLARYLKEPDDRPDYRGDRSHVRFVQNIPLTANDLRAVVRRAFAAHEPLDVPHPAELERARQLAEDKYETEQWRRRR